MTRQEFEKCMALLIETYTDRAYPPPRVARIWNWARKVNGKTFAEAVDNAIADSMQAPLLSKLKDYCAEVRARHPDRDKIACDFCDGSGWILSGGLDTEKRIYTTPIAFVCKCENGNMVPDQYPRWQGPWTRIVPHPSELMRAAVSTVINSTFKKIDAVEVDRE